MADYSAWQGNNYDALNITTNTQILPSEEATTDRRISGFSLIGRNNSNVTLTANGWNCSLGSKSHIYLSTICSFPVLTQAWSWMIS
jgi:hypothetical protein